jgi:phospholipase C
MANSLDAQLPGVAAVQHVIVLVLENRSFDHMLGFLVHPDPKFDGLTGKSGLGNRLDPKDPASDWFPAESTADYVLPLDPDHEHYAVMGQIETVAGTPNAGFVRSYVHKQLETARGENLRRMLRVWTIRLLIAAVLIACVGVASRSWATAIVGASMFVITLVGLWWTRPRQLTDAQRTAAKAVAPYVMRAFDPERIPVLATLAKEFGLCQHWHASVPGETWPNRNFIHAGSSGGSVNIEFGTYGNRTIFEALDAPHGDESADPSAWRVYYGQFPPQVFAFPYVLERSVHQSGSLRDLLDDIDRQSLPKYAFVEPHHGLLGKTPSCSQHPGNNSGSRDGNDFRAGERLIAEIYERLRLKPELFSQTLLVLTYDEHGGLYDHCTPPLTIAPGGRSDSLTRRLLRFLIPRNYGHAFGFRRLGVRVPCIVISPWVRAGALDSEDRDHCSIPRTIRALFAPNEPRLSRREAKAGSLTALLDLPSARNGEELPNLQATLERLRSVPLFPEDRPDVAPLPPSDAFERQLVALTDAIKRGTVEQLLSTPAGAPTTSVLATTRPRRGRTGPRRARQLQGKTPEELRELLDTTEFYLGALAATQLE